MKEKIFVVITIVTVCIVSFVGGKMKKNDITNTKDYITERYSGVQIEELKTLVESQTVTYAEFKEIFNIQCVRETYQGYYVILLQEDDKKVFVFINNEDILTNVIIVDKFKTKEEFQLHVSEQMSENDVLSFEPNTILSPISSVELTVHYVQEGIYIIKYSRFLDGEIMENPIISSMEFVPNESISTSEDVFVRDEIPFILEADKLSE